MTSLVVRHLDPGLKERLKERAARHGHSMEEEVRSILRTAIATDTPAQATGLGSRMAARFAGIGLDEPLPELRGEWARVPDFKE